MDSGLQPPPGIGVLPKETLPQITVMVPIPGALLIASQEVIAPRWRGMMVALPVVWLSSTSAFLLSLETPWTKTA